jgi:putative ABC transport system substrate-binding protein
MGLVASLAHPGGNITGQTFLVPELVAKRLQFLEQIVPSMTRAGVLLMRNSQSNANMLGVLGVAATALKVELRPIEIAEAGELEGAISAAVDEKIGGLVSTDQALFIGNAAAIAAIAQKRGLPSIGGLLYARNDGLMGYGVDILPMFLHAAVFVDKILKGEKPGDIPIEQATKFQTIVNLKTAKALGVEIPPLLLASADEVIE